MKRWGIIAVALGLLAVGGFIGLREVRQWRTCQDLEAAASVFKAGPGGADVLVVGDSYSVGYELDDPRRSWVAAYSDASGQTAAVRGESGTGFVNPGPCDGTTIPARVDDRGGVTIIQGGLNDVGYDGDETAAACEAIEAAGGDAVVVGPPLAPAWPAEGVRDVDAALARAVAECGGRYVSTVDWDDLDYLPSGMHLTEASHEVFGRRVAQALR